MLLVNFGYGTLVLHRIREKVVAASEPWTAHSGNGVIRRCFSSIEYACGLIVFTRRLNLRVTWFRGPHICPHQRQW